MFGTKDGSGDLFDIKKGTETVKGGIVADVKNVAWTSNAPYTVFAGLNLLACDMSDDAAEVVAVVPVTRTFEGADGAKHGATLLKSSIVVPTGKSSDGGAFVTLAKTELILTENGFATDE